MVMSSLAGCIGDLEEEVVVVDDSSTAPLGTVIASTYHVEQLLSAVAGDTLNVELLSPINEPVHDYSPTPDDVLRLQGADLFFYHGLGLEPWVEATLTGLSTAAPTSISTHAMPTGEVTLDYESILISELCEHISEGPFQNTTLGMDDGSMPEIHAEHVVYSMSYPHMDEEHDDDHSDDGHDDDHDDDHSGDGHDDEHSEDGHDDDHDDHAGHGHASPMETITNPSGCPTDYVIVIYELEKGDVVIEFEAEDDHDFDMVVLKMGGGHAHHDHGHDDHGDEDGDHDGHGDEDGDHDDHGEEDGDHDDHEGEHGEYDHDHCDNGTAEDPHDHSGCDDEMTPEMALQSFDTNNDSHLSWDEFWAGWNSEDDDHDNHNGSHDAMEEAMEEYMTELLYEAFNQSDMHYYNGGNNDAGDGLLNMSELVIFIEEIDHIDDDLESAATQIMISMFDEDGDGSLNMTEFTDFMEIMDDDHDEDHSDEDNGDNHPDHHDDEPGVHHHGDDNVHHEHNDTDDTTHDVDDRHHSHGDHEDHGERTFHCSSTVGGDVDTEIPFDKVNDGTEDCGDGSDEPQDFDGDGTVDNWFTCMGDSSDSPPPTVYEAMENDTDNSGTINFTEFRTSWEEEEDRTMTYEELTSFSAIFNQSDMYYYNGGSNDAGDGELNESELQIFINLMEMMNRTTISMELVNDGNDDCPEGDDESHEHDSVIMLCYDWSTGTMNTSYTNQADCVAGGSTLQWIDMGSAIMQMMFNMYDNNSDGLINASELDMMMEMGDDDHDGHDEGHEDHGVIGFANLHVEAEGEYGFLLPADVTLHVLSGGEGHSDHGDHGDHGDEDGDHADHGDEEGDHDDHDDHAEEEIPFDPHSWLDPIAFKAQIDVVLTALITAFPSAEEDFTANANAYKLELDMIAMGFEDAFGEGGTCTVEKTVAANHNAYSYLAQRYDLEFVTVHGLDPEGEPAAEDIVEVVEKIEEEDITVFFVEEYTDISSVDSIVSQTGVTILYLYTMEMPPSTDGEDYLSLMQKNLDNLITGIGC